MADTSDLMTTEEAAAFLRVHPVTLRRMVATGKVRAIRLGSAQGRMRFRRADLEAAAGAPVFTYEPVTLQPRTSLLLREQAAVYGQSADQLADDLLSDALTDRNETMAGLRRGTEHVRAVDREEYVAQDRKAAPPAPSDESGERLDYSARELLKLPASERDRILRAQAKRMAPYYEADLALPPAERELTAFTAIPDDILDPAEYLGEQRG